MSRTSRHPYFTTVGVSLPCVCHYRTCVTVVRVSLLRSGVSLLERHVYHVLLDSLVSLLERHVTRQLTGQSVLMSVFLNVRLSKLHICPYMSGYPHVHTCPPVCMSVFSTCPPVRLPVCPRARLPARPPARLPACPPARQFVRLSVCTGRHKRPLHKPLRAHTHTHANTCTLTHTHTLTHI